MCLYKYMHVDTRVCVPHSYCRAHCSCVSQPQINPEVLIVVVVLKKIFTITSFSCKKTLVDITIEMFSKCLQVVSHAVLHPSLPSWVSMVVCFTKRGEEPHSWSLALRFCEGSDQSGRIPSLPFLSENILVTGQQAAYSNMQGWFQFQNIYLNKLCDFNFTGKTLENTVQLWSFIYSSFKKVTALSLHFPVLFSSSQEIKRIHWTIDKHPSDRIWV